MRLHYKVQCTTFGGDAAEAFFGAHVVGGECGVAAGVCGLHLVDGDLVAAVGGVVAVHGHARRLSQLNTVLETVVGKCQLGFAK